MSTSRKNQIKKNNSDSEADQQDGEAEVDLTEFSEELLIFSGLWWLFGSG